jgi:hypothetical protein
MGSSIFKLMIGFQAAKNRFSLFYLEENELYIQDLSAIVSFFDFRLHEEKYPNPSQPIGRNGAKCTSALVR